MQSIFASLGLGESAQAGLSESTTAIEFVSKVRDACTENNGKGDLHAYKELWASAQRQRELGGSKFDELVAGDSLMKWLKFAFRHKEAAWREEGVRVARTFFHLKDAREKLVTLDFVGSLLLITLPDEKAEGEDDEQEDGAGGKQGVKDARLVELQLLAVQVTCEMADYDEFIPALCTASVLNFLCVVLNQVPSAVEVIAHTFVKLARSEETLVVLVEGSVGDILESFFKTVKYKRPVQAEEEEIEQWARDTNALSYCAHTLGTLVKYNHPCQVHLPTTIAVFSDALAMLKEEDKPDNVQLSAEMCRLFYWVCRRSSDVGQTLLAADADLDYVLKVLVKLWKHFVDTYNLVENCPAVGTLMDSRLSAFLVDDLDPKKKLDLDSDAARNKMHHARMRLCYINCTLWVLLPESNLRWKLKHFGLQQLYLAFSLTDPEFLRVILSTVRYLVDLPRTQECAGLVSIFGGHLLTLLDKALKGDMDTHNALVRLLLDAFCILSMQRSMQDMLAENDVFDKLTKLSKRFADKLSVEQSEVEKLELAVCRTLGNVAMYPAHRLSWIGKHGVDPTKVYPPRKLFVPQLEMKMKGVDEHIKSIASLLLTTFKEERFEKPANELETTFKSVLDWWKVNTTARYEDHREDAPADGQRRPPTSMEAMPYTAPHECCLALSLFSRLALEPKFKPFFTDDALQALLGCVAGGIWAEAREAIAVLANLMWLPDIKQERLVCWLKFDGPKCGAVDAANVLMCTKIGHPKSADIGKGMYKSTWGAQFVEGSCVMLHPDGLKTYEVPGILTAASPSDTFVESSRRPYQWLDTEKPHPKQFTVTCWFYWPLGTRKHQHVLLQSAAPDHISHLYFDATGEDSNGVWTLIDDQKTRRPLKTPRLNPGWHMLALVSSTSEHGQNSFNGTKFFLDDWNCTLPDVWVQNDFGVVGNDAGQALRRPFGLMCDFRIYARTLPDDEVQAMSRQPNPQDHPDQIARKLASMGAADVLARRLDVPDSAAEALRALGSLATLQSQRAKIYSVCGRQVLRMLDSPLPMIRRQAMRLVTNIS
eukprot:TRINITY_DN9756_c0_g4_i1.p1 TRINITY_DN9756_c0_g4~~TRINITY_DN9756_c0_g4_i1.p1  ORF type:complete len:1049 (+),score=158.05 TRINITY_DN9756_c0_g4_i1:60-3206(+)